MSDALLISVRFHEGWYHGSGGTPSPARLFQALVAGTGISGPLDEETVEALEWLEMQNHPIVASPHTTSQRPYVNYVPNNEADASKGYQERIKKAEKRIAPILFDPEVPFLFAWKLADDVAVEAAKRVLPLADCVYQLGRTVDMGWAWAEFLSEDVLRNHLTSYPGVVRFPSAGSGNVDCPTRGSLASLIQRHQAGAHQFARTADGKGQTVRQCPKAKWKKVNYEGVATHFILELRQSDDAGFAPWPLERTSALVERIRDGAAAKLRSALTDRSPEIDRILIGREPNGENAGPTSERVRIMPLPSIGHPQADMQLRRVLVEVLAECPIRPDDIAWSMSGLRLDQPVTGELIDLTPFEDRTPLGFFGVGKPARIWRSITPLVLPEATRRRIDPIRKDADAKPGSEKREEHARAAFAVAQALRHAGITTDFSSIRVQREPFDQRGTRVEGFAESTRFDKHCMWHVELEFTSSLHGPLALGNGRFLGLGIMRPVTPLAAVFAFSIESGLRATPDPIRIARALRRAVMARTRDVLGGTKLPPYFSGHRGDGEPAGSEEPHLTFVFDPLQRLLLVVTPEHLDRRDRWHDAKNREILEAAVQGLRELRAGADGYFQLRPAIGNIAGNRLFQSSCIWESVTPYDVNRHGRKSTVERILMNDVISECQRRGLPIPEVTVLDWDAVSRVGLRGWLRLHFKVEVQGLIILGRSRFIGGGLFAPLEENA